MYKIIGVDGKEYGPVTLDQLKQWISQGRINPQTPVQEVGAAEWKKATQIPELGLSSGSIPPLPAPLRADGSAQPQRGLAITSFVLGLLSLFCLFIFSGVPAVICGHLAQNRARKSPGQYGGAGLAIAGFLMGYLGIFLTFAVLPALLLPALSRAKGKAEEINCMNNMKQIGLAFKTWALDNTNQYPFHVSTNYGGSLELCARGSDGFDSNSAIHLMILSNELSTPIILVCVADHSKSAADDFEHLQPANVSYQVRSGSNINENTPQQVLVVCPIHGHQLLCDGSVVAGKRARGGAGGKTGGK